jgi:hypothetical protein
MPLSSRLRDTSHYLSELPHDRDFMIRVRAENDFGMSEPTEPLWLPRATGSVLFDIHFFFRLLTLLSLCNGFAQYHPVKC